MANTVVFRVPKSDFFKTTDKIVYYQFIPELNDSEKIKVASILNGFSEVVQFFDIGSEPFYITNLEIPFKNWVIISKKSGVTDDETSRLFDFFPNKKGVFRGVLYLFNSDDYKIPKFNPVIEEFFEGSKKQPIHFKKVVKTINNPTVEIIELKSENLLKISKERNLSLTYEEMESIMSYKNIITDCELEIVAQTWSEHCKHKEFRGKVIINNLSEYRKKTVINSLFNTYIKGATHVVSKNLKKIGADWIVSTFDDNAGIVKANSKYNFAWKVETHNSPSAIDPYGGAITGILGNNRDPIGTGKGGAKALFNTDVLCFGYPNYNKKLLEKQLHPKDVFLGVRAGIQDGGNKMGIPTINGATIFDEKFSGKPLVFCGTGALMPQTHFYGDIEKKEIKDGDIICVVGGKTGKDGIHGATFSSETLTKESPSSAVQIGSPYTQKIVFDFLEEASKFGYIRTVTDNGAGGLSSSIGELAILSNGASVELSKVPLKYSGLLPWEIFLSESQERMTIVVPKKFKKQIFELAKEMETTIEAIGEFHNSGFLTVFYEGRLVAELNLDFLHNGCPLKIMECRPYITNFKKNRDISEFSLDDICKKILSSLNVASKESIVRMYDHEVKGKTVIKPYMGQNGNSPQDSGVMRFDFDSYDGVAVSNGINPKYYKSPYDMSAGAFDEAIRSIISVGGGLPNRDRFWSVNDNFCMPNVIYDQEKNREGMFNLWCLVEMNRALYDISTAFSIPLTSGKDSMKNDFYSDGVKISVPPTILYSATSYIKDVRKTVTTNVKNSNEYIFIVNRTYNELYESEFYRALSISGGVPPKVRVEKALNVYKKMEIANRESLINSSHDISDGGFFIAILESLFKTGFGATVELSNFNKEILSLKNRKNINNTLSSKKSNIFCKESTFCFKNSNFYYKKDNLNNFINTKEKQKSLNDFINTKELKNILSLMFSESHSRFVVTVSQKNLNRFLQIFKNDVFFMGKTDSSNKFKLLHKNRVILNENLDYFYEIYQQPIESILK